MFFNGGNDFQGRTSEFKKQKSHQFGLNQTSGYHISVARFFWGGGVGVVIEVKPRTTPRGFL